MLKKSIVRAVATVSVVAALGFAAAPGMAAETTGSNVVVVATQPVPGAVATPNGFFENTLNYFCRRFGVLC